ncbi:MAG: hypothetical protein D6775_03245 [Caldilineae bacterium]|nr:MAG: hypothetical protein D6775_03245 [Caldilineae bacterium]
MSIPPKVHILNRFSGAEDDTLLFLPNLTLWYGWHHRHGTLPVDWQDLTLSQICAELGVPVWESVRPYEIEWGAVRVERHESEQHREIRYCLGTDTLVERWQLGPDGDWWQVEYPVKSHADLAVLLKMVRERSYRWLPERLEPVLEAVGEAGTVAALLPRRPFAQLLLEWLGWSEGLMLLFDAEMAAQQILRLLEEQVASVEERAAQLPVEIIVSPDNLDAQFISPGFFARYLSDSYRRAAARFHKAGKYLMVDTGGAVWHLLEHLAAGGVDGVQGVCGPPQSDAPLARARAVLGPDFTLWGGIPQDALLPQFPRDRFEESVQEAMAVARQDSRVILGIADRVPVQADLGRLQQVIAWCAA